MAARKRKKTKPKAFDSFYDAGLREDLANALYSISPKVTPFLANKAGGASIFEWNTEPLVDPRWSAHDTEKLGETWGICPECGLATENRVGKLWKHEFCPKPPQAEVIGAADVYESDFGRLVVPKSAYAQISRKSWEAFFPEEKT